jgi:Arc/MetJ-type ribon-helix-helix transcriptional regulator
LPGRPTRVTVTIMAHELSPQTEQYLARIVAGGLYPSKEAAIEAAVDALREKNEQLLAVPDEQVDLVEQAIASSRAGKSRPLNAAEWSNLRQLARDAASGNASSST